MRTAKRTEKREQIEKLTEEQRDDYFTRLITGEDVLEDVKTSQGVFTVKYPRVTDLLTIGKIEAARRNFRPVEGFDYETEMLNTMASTLDVVVVSGPNWFEKARKSNNNFSFLEVPSRKFLAELYGKAVMFREEVEQCLDKGEEPADRRVPTEKGPDDVMDSGASGTLSNKQDNTET